MAPAHAPESAVSSSKSEGGPEKSGEAKREREPGGESPNSDIGGRALRFVL